ncbi:hypothetical protein FIC_00338 [Flavobacteriaceae bacterium 3519-10]|nr:hypothetical protein FIC_00338 [Flavobacteriaceae bacterium 3519-10]
MVSILSQTKVKRPSKFRHYLMNSYLNNLRSIIFIKINNLKPSVLIISDFPQWAYHGIQHFIAESLNSEYDFYYDFLIFNSKRRSKNPKTILSNYFLKKKYTKLKNDRHYDIVLYLAFYFDEQMKINFTATKTIKGIYTDGFPPSNSTYEGDVTGFMKRFFSNTDAMVCGSQNIRGFYEPVFSKVYFANGVIDDKLFSRKSARSKDKFVIGWTGNPNREFKGYYSHILPAIEILKKKYEDIEFVSRFSGPLVTLPQFYEQLHLVIIASEADAGPALFGEASLMEVPCVTTKIGWPAEVIQDGLSGFFVEREVRDIVSKVEVLYNNRSLLESMAVRIRVDYQNHFNKDQMIDNWRTLFNNVLT